MIPVKVDWLHLAGDNQWRTAVKTGCIRGEEFLD